MTKTQPLYKELVAVTAALVAAIYLLEHGGRKAAPSDKMFKQMIADYRRALNEARSAICATDKAAPCETEFVWLVEHFANDGNSTGDYYAEDGGTTKDALKAVRFDSWAKAKAAKDRLGHAPDGDWRVTEHGFIHTGEQA